MTDEEFSKHEAERLAGTIAWLEQADPDDWHRFALDFQWAEPFDTLYWIVQQERCDRATAQMLFWQCQPSFFLEEDEGFEDAPDPHTDWNKEIVVHIARRFSSGGYARSELAYTADTSTRTDYVDLCQREEGLDNPNFRASPGLIENRSGREVWPDREFYARLPEAFWHGSPPSEAQDGIEYAPLEPPGYRETMRVLDLVEQEARRRLPKGLKTGPDPVLDLTEVRAEARWLALYTICAGSNVALLTQLHGPKLLSLASVALVWVCWSSWSSLREIRSFLRYSRRRLHTPWVGALLGTILTITFGITSISLGAIGNLRINYGLVPTALAGLVLILPLLWLAARPLAGLLVGPRGIVAD